MSSQSENCGEAKTVKADALSGTLIDGKYEVGEKLSHGGIGIVYKGRHTLIDRTVAIKVLHSHLVEDDEWLKRFQNEAQIASKVSHPHAILIYDFGVFHGLPYLVMEFADGVTLKEKIKNHGSLSIHDVCLIFEQTCAALQNAHQLGIVHRDLKPDNIMITEHGDNPIWVEVLDFGIAKIVHGDKPSGMNDLTQTGMFHGTPKYASPEQVLGKELDPRSDIYSLGVILYEALSGEVPFDAPSVMGTLLKQLNETPQPIRKVRPSLEIPRALDDLVMKCLEKDPKDRYQTVDVLARDLQSIRESLRARQRVKMGNGALTLAVSGVLVIGIAGTSAWLLGMFSPKPREESTETFVRRDTAEKGSGISLEEKGTETTTPSPPTTQREKVEPWVLKSLIALVTETRLPPSVSDAGVPQPPPPGDAPPDVMSEENSREAQLRALEELSKDDDEEGTRSERSGPIGDDRKASGALLVKPSADPGDAPLDKHAAVPDVSSEELKETSDRSHEVVNVKQDEQRSAESGNSLDGKILFEEGDKLLKQGRYRDAMEKLEKAVALKPSSMRARLALGVAYLKLDRRAEAFKEFEAARKIDGGYAPVHLNLACYYALSGQREAALEALERMVHLNPRSRSWVKREPDLNSLRGDPRFEAILNPN